MSKIDITGIDLVKFVQRVYDLSSPQGLGYLHYVNTPLSEEEAKEYVDLNPKYGRNVVSMDYVHGRACKMQVWKEDEKLYINDSWYDHTDHQLKLLLEPFKISVPSKGEHGVSCGCFDCQLKQTETYIRGNN
jgi:hypothetical protein